METRSGDIEQALVNFVQETDYTRLPTRAIEVARSAFLDSIGVALAGSQTPDRKLLDDFAEPGSQEIATIIGTGLRAPVLAAALANGILVNALDYSDASEGWLGEPSPVLVPAILAMGEKCHSTGKEILTAYVIGFEVGAKLGMAVGKELFARGWHLSSIFGSIAGAASAAKLLKLEAHQTRVAMGIAVALTSGLRTSFGTLAKPLQAGNAARNACLAALLAKKGFTASENAFSGKFAFVEVFGGNKNSLLQAFQQLGSSFDIISPERGLWQKPYPSCGAGHGAIDAALQLRKQYSFAVNDIEQIECEVGDVLLLPMIYHRPGTVLEAKFSLEYGVCVSLIDGKATLAQFTDDRVKSKDIARLLPKVKLVHPSSTKGKIDLSLPVKITLTLRGGKESTSAVSIARGKPGNPLTTAELKSKFEDCLQAVFSDKRKIDAIYNYISKLEEANDINTLTGML